MRWKSAWRTAAALLLLALPLPAQYPSRPELGPPPIAPPEKDLRQRLATDPPLEAAGGWIDTSNRAQVQSMYNSVYKPALSVPMNWNGNVATGDPGTTSQAYKDAVTTIVNWYRGMAGVPMVISMNAVYSAKNQQAALMFSANGQLNHYPPTTWTWYTAEGAEAAGKSNICLWSWGMPTGCIDAYMEDYGSNNTAVGHRRWILRPQSLTMGTGDTSPPSNSWANALWVLDGTPSSPRPATRDTFVTWPSKGYFPYDLVPDRWSFSYPNASFPTAAPATTVTMVRDGVNIPVTLLTVANGYGENTLVWTPASWDYAKPAVDSIVTVTLNNVVVGGVAQNFSYQVILFDASATYAFLPTSASAAAGGGTGSTQVQVSPSTTTWAVSSSATWLHITSAANGTGTAMVNYSLDPNSGTSSRSATLNTAGAIFTVTQAGLTPTYAFAPNTAAPDSAGGTGSTQLQVSPASAAWTLTSSAAWLHVTSTASGTGTAAVTYSVDANAATLPRTATLTAGGAIFTVTQSGATPSAMRFAPVTPCRIADTRGAAGPFGGPFLTGNTSRSFAIPQSACNIPATAQAYSLNVTVIPRVALNYLTLWPTGQAQPLVSTLNSLTGDVVANAAIVPAGSGGAVSMFVTNDTDVILDINGYFDATTGASFYADTPCRVADTRGATGPFGGPSLSAGQTRNFTVPSSACAIPSSATAYSMNYTVVPTGFLGYLSTWPAGQGMPGVSTLNSWKGKVLANAAIVPAGSGGGISVYASNQTEVILDINGHFGPTGGSGELKFYPVTPCRVADTRNATGALGGPILNGGATRSFAVPQSSCGIPAAAKAYSVNVTVVPSGPLYYLTAWPTGGPQPLVSTLNSFDGSITANAAIIPAGTNGAINIYVTNSTHVVLDINGYFQ